MAGSINIWGCGYIGTLSSLYFSSLGNAVTGIDTAKSKIDSLKNRKSHFYEPGLNTLFQNIPNDNLDFKLNSEIDHNDPKDFDFICVSTPNKENGELDLEQIFRVIEEIHNDNHPHNIVIRSTIPIDSIIQLENVVSKYNKSSTLSFMPEFMREGNAIDDTFNNNLIIIGCDKNLTNNFQNIFNGKENRKINYVSKEAAASIKLVNNSWHALKIAYANEIGRIFSNYGVPVEELTQLFLSDEKLNLGKAYLKPGFAFGGSCLPKDTKGLVHLASKVTNSFPLIGHIIESNNEHIVAYKEWLIKELSQNKDLFIYGITFKKETDDLRNSSIIELIKHLSLHSDLNIWLEDPIIFNKTLFGENKRILEDLFIETTAKKLDPEVLKLPNLTVLNVYEYSLQDYTILPTHKVLTLKEFYGI